MKRSGNVPLPGLKQTVLVLEGRGGAFNRVTCHSCRSLESGEGGSTHSHWLEPLVVHT